jgi:hypothetical protein
MDFTAELHRRLTNTKLKLQKEHGWSEDYTTLCVNEYAKFLHLHVTYPEGKIVPGRQLDNVWHVHILHTKEYADFCEKFLHGFLHHTPKDLSSNEVNDMQHTLDLYEQCFGYKAPVMFWTEEPAPKNKIIPSKVTVSTVTRVVVVVKYNIPDNL